MIRGRAAVLASAAALALAPALAAERAFDLKLVGGKLAERTTLRVAKGDQVELRWTSDRRIVLHLHGYDIEVTATPESSARMAFTAGIAGRFPVSEHAQGKNHHHRPVLYLEVHP